LGGRAADSKEAEEGEDHGDAEAPDRDPLLGATAQELRSLAVKGQ